MTLKNHSTTTRDRNLQLRHTVSIGLFELSILELSSSLHRENSENAKPWMPKLLAISNPTHCASRFCPSLIHGLCPFFASNSRFMRPFQAALDTPLDSPFSATLSVHGLHFTVCATWKCDFSCDLYPFFYGFRGDVGCDFASAVRFQIVVRFEIAQRFRFAIWASKCQTEVRTCIIF